MPSIVNVILSALAASHHRMPNIPGPDVRKQVSFPSGNGACTPDQQKTVMNAMAEAALITNNWLATAQPTSLPFKTFFEPHKASDRVDTVQVLGMPPGTTVLSIVNNVAKQIQKSLTDDSTKLEITCDFQDAACQKPDVQAETKKADRRINFCSLFFDKAGISTRSKDLSNLKCTSDNMVDVRGLDMSGADHLGDLEEVRSLTVVHELAHMADTGSPNIDKNGEIMDVFYGPYGCEALAYGAPRAALGNADNYAWAMMAQFLNTVCWGPKDTTYYRTWKMDEQFAAKFDFWKQGYLHQTKVSKMTADVGDLINDRRPKLLAKGVVFDNQDMASLPAGANADPKLQAEIEEYNEAMEARRGLTQADAKAREWLMLPINDIGLRGTTVDMIKADMNTRPKIPQPQTS